MNFQVKPAQPITNNVLHDYVEKDSNWRVLFKTVNQKIVKNKRLGTYKIGSYKKGTTSKDGIYFGTKSAGSKITLILLSSKKKMDNATPTNLRTAYIREVWKEFDKQLLKIGNKEGVKDWKAGLSDEKKGRENFGDFIKASHDRDSTTAMLGAQQDMANNKDTVFVGTSMDLTIHDLYEELKNIKVDWGQTVKKKKYAEYSAENVITINIQRNPNNPLSDSKGLQKRLVKFLTKKDYTNKLIDAFDIRNKASKPLADQWSEDIIEDIVRPLTKAGKPDRRYKINREGGKNKKFKTIKRGANITSPRKAKPKKKSISGGTVVKSTFAKKGSKGEKGQGRPAATNQAADLARLTAYINSRLPAEVRRNMGRPALINQTGRFSNSVQLISLRQAQSTVMAKYTYLLNPYATFENTGKKQWPLAYNPKPLIAKSIRNLAQGRIENKLTLRRV